MTPADPTPHCPELAKLDAWLDRELPPDAHAAFEAHAAACVPCRRATESAQRVRAWARALPAELTPPRDPWEGIAAVISDRTPGIPARDDRVASQTPWNDRPAAPSVRKVPWTWAAAAAILLSVGTSTGTAAWMRRTEPPAAVPAADVQLVAAWEDEARTATEELAAALEARRGELDPDTLAVVERNLAIIDEAIAETRAALSLDPADDRARGALVAAYNQKIRVLQRTLRLSST